jgi:2-amino-4-hydroxy-6-hydroxymethyldihydropteridine diphosphokinase
VNAVAEFETDLSAESLLEWLQQVEVRQGRVKLRHWGERLIDLDILLYGEQQIKLPNLIIPHPCLTERDFVLLPLAELWPNVVLPGLGSIQTFICQLESHYVVQPSTEGTL